MRKLIALMAFTSCFFNLNAQVQSGSLVESGRKQVGTTSFTINTAAEGTVIIELAVNRVGVVTSTRVILEESTVSSTPQVMKARNLAKKLKFTPGTHYAEYEHVRVKYTYIKQ